MIVKDDRTPEQKKTHTYLVAATDRVLSSWGLAAGGSSFAVWACESAEERDLVAALVRARGDMQRVRYVSPDYRPRGAAHVHIYVARAVRE